MKLRSFFFFFNDTATTEIYTLSLHDALPICRGEARTRDGAAAVRLRFTVGMEVILLTDVEKVGLRGEDRKSTRLNSSHSQISYAVFCLKKKKRNLQTMNSAALP